MDFQKYGSRFSFENKANTFDGYEMGLSLIEWLDAQNMEMQLIELKSGWVNKFAELQKYLEIVAVQDSGTCIFTCWASLLEKFSDVQNVTLALLSAF